MPAKLNNSATKSGFTIIELSLSIAFIAVLSIAVTLIIVNSISSYRRGITLNQLNTTGMDLVDDMRASVQDSSIGSISGICSTLYADDSDSSRNCKKDGAHNFVSVTRNADVTVGGKNINNVPVFGAFCTGNYSYIWNSGYFFNSDDDDIKGVTMATLKYRLAGSDEIIEESNFKLLKVEDEARSVCISAVLGDTANSSKPRYTINAASSNSSQQINSGKSEFNISDSRYNLVETLPVDLLNNSSNGNMAIYDITAMTPASGAVAKKLFYSVSFVLGTVQGGINVKSQGNYCATPEGYRSAEENFDYCAINKFNFAAQTTGG